MIDIKIYNLLIHYWEKSSKVFLDLFDDGLYNLLLDPPILKIRNRNCYISDVHVFTRKSKPILSGQFYRESKLDWDYVPGKDSKAVDDPGSQKIMPVAKFYVDLSSHTFFWATERGKTHSPTPIQFVYYFKKSLIEMLKERYRPVAEEIYKEKNANKKLLKKEINKFCNSYFVDKKLTSKLFSIKMVPLIKKRAFNDFLTKERYLLEKMKIKPNKANPIPEELAGMFGYSDILEDETESNITYELTAKDSKAGIKKNIVRDMLTEARKTKQLLIKMILKDQEIEKASPITVSNFGDQNTDVDLSLKFSFDSDLNEISALVDSLDLLNEEGIDLSDEELNRAQKILAKLRASLNEK